MTHTLTLVDQNGSSVNLASGETITLTLNDTDITGVDAVEAADFASQQSTFTITGNGGSSYQVVNGTLNDSLLESTEGYAVSIASIDGSSTRFEALAIPSTQNTAQGQIIDNETLLISDTVSDDDDVDENTDADTANDIVHGGTISDLDTGLSYRLEGPSGLTSNGQQVTYSWNAGNSTLVATAGSTVVFTVALDLNADTYTFTQAGSLDHAVVQGENDLVATFNAYVEQGANQIANTTFSVTVNDDVPVVNGPVNITTLNDGSETLSGSLPVTLSNDLTDFTWDQAASSSTTLYAKGQVVNATYDDTNDIVRGTVDGGATEVFVLDIDVASKSYLFELKNELVGRENTAQTLLSGGNTDVVQLDFGDSSTNNVFVSAIATSSSTNASPTVNTSNQTIGVDDQFINSKYSDVLTIDFADARLSNPYQVLSNPFSCCRSGLPWTSSEAVKPLHPQR